MKRFSLLLGSIAIVFASSARADVTYTEAGTDDDKIAVVRMTVTPAPQPVPALRYRLTRRDIELKNGNAAPFYYRAQLDLLPAMKNMREKFDEEKELALWYTTGASATPIAKLPLDKVREASGMFDPIVNNHLKPAFEFSDCDWQIDVENLRGIDIIQIHLNEFQNSREISRMLVLRTRLAIAGRRYDDAIETMRQQFRLGGDVATVPFLVCGLIGIAIDSMTTGTLVELIASPDSPNMYWAIAQMPEPLIDLHPAVRFEMDFGPRLFPFLHNAETTDHSPQEWNRLLGQSLHDLQQVGGPAMMFADVSADKHEVAAGLAATAIGLLGYSHAKGQLIAQGKDRERVETMSVGQVIAIYTERSYQRFADEWEKLWYMPYGEMLRHVDPLVQQIVEARVVGGGDQREVLPLVSLLLPAMQAARNAQVRLERDVAALRVIEALRMHAANHDGQLPKTLDEITVVPVPTNPATSKPFAYRLEGATAILELPRSDQLQGGDRRYEIQIAGAEK